MGSKAGMRSGKAASYLLVALLGGVVGGMSSRMVGAGPGPLPVLGGNIRPYTEVVERGQPAATGETVVRVVHDVGPAVISINTLSRRNRPEGFFGVFGGEPDVAEGQGSGFIINGRDRLAVTNNHVVENANRIEVTLPDKRSFSAEVVGTDPFGDTALIRLSGGGDLPEIKFGDSDKLKIGQVTIAIGNPLGLRNSVTQGVLSQMGRELPGNNGIPLDNLLQTDAAINPGNSGGPLIDAYGTVIGMNTAIISTAQGIGFAVAANSIKRSVSDILKYGKAIRPWIGVSMVDLTPAEARERGIPGRNLQGVAIDRVVRGSPAEKAGLESNDVINELNGQKVNRKEDLRQSIRQLHPGDKITLKGTREDKPQTWTVTVGEMPPPSSFGR